MKVLHLFCGIGGGGLGFDPAACRDPRTICGLRLNGTVDELELHVEHQVWRRRVVRSGSGPRQLREPEFVRAGDLDVGDRLGFHVPVERAGTARAFVESFGDPREITRGGRGSGRYAKPEHHATAPQTRDLRPHAESSALFFLLGAYLGDGYRRVSRGEVIYCVGASGGELWTRIRDAALTLGLSARESDEGGPTNVKLHVASRHLCTLAGAFGDGAAEKSIPDSISELEAELLDALVDGYRATDGSESPERPSPAGSRFQPRWRIASVSLPLLRGLQRLLLRRGEYGRIHVAWPGGAQVIEGRTVATKPRWELAVAADPHKRTTHEFIDGVIWIRIREIWVRRPAEART